MLAPLNLKIFNWGAFGTYFTGLCSIPARHLPARIPGHLALLGRRARSQWQAGREPARHREISAEADGRNPKLGPARRVGVRRTNSKYYHTLNSA